MKILKRIIILVIVIAALFGISKLFKNNNSATNGNDFNTTLSLDEIGSGKINDGIIVLSQKESENVIDETSDVDFSENNIVIKFKKKTPKALENLEKDEIILIRPSQENKKDKNEILSQGLAVIVQSVGRDSISLTSANIEDIFNELVIDTSLIENQISESSVYLADGVSLEKQDIYLASSDQNIKFNLVNEKNDGAPKIEKLGINVEEKKIGNTTISGDIEITDLTIDYKLDYKKGRESVVDAFKYQILGDISSSLEVESKMSTESSKDTPKNVFEKLKDDNTLAYILFNLGAVPVEVGTGDVISPALGVGIFINCNRDGEPSIETNLVFNYSDSIKSGVELSKENNESKIKIIDKEEKPTVNIIANGIEIDGESKFQMKLESAVVVLGANLASISLDRGIDMEGKIALDNTINLSEEELNLDDNLEGSLNVDFFDEFNAMINVLKLADIESEYNKELTKYNIMSFPKVIEFDGRTVDLSGLEEVSVLEEDINGDKIKDRIAMYGIKDQWANEGKYIVIFNGKNNKVLTTVDCEFMSNRLLEIIDINEDGRKEIHYGSFYGHGYGSHILEYKDKTYKLIEFKDTGLSYNVDILDGFKVRLTEPTLGIDQTVNLTEEQREKYINFKAYSKNGKLINESYLNKSSKSRNSKILDIDNDGVLELIKQTYISGTAEADSIYAIINVYKYIDGEFVAQDAFIQAGVQEYTEDYVEAEEFVMKEEPFAKPSDGMIHMIVENVNIQDGYVDADEVQWVTLQGVSTGYRIDGIDGDISKYKLSNDCKFATMTMKPMDPDAGTTIDISGFKSAIDDNLKKFPEVARARLCIAKIENGEITKISTVYLP